MTWVAVVPLIVVTAAVVVLILVFERRRARQIQRDLGGDADRDARGDDGSA